MIADDLFRQLKKLAAEQGRPLQEVANDFLRRGLNGPKNKPFRLKLVGWKAKAQPA